MNNPFLETLERMRYEIVERAKENRQLKAENSELRRHFVAVTGEIYKYDPGENDGGRGNDKSVVTKQISGNDAKICPPDL